MEEWSSEDEDISDYPIFTSHQKKSPFNITQLFEDIPERPTSPMPTLATILSDEENQSKTIPPPTTPPTEENDITTTDQVMMMGGDRVETVQPTTLRRRLGTMEPNFTEQPTPPPSSCTCSSSSDEEDDDDEEEEEDDDDDGSGSSIMNTMLSVVSCILVVIVVLTIILFVYRFGRYVCSVQRQEEIYNCVARNHPHYDVTRV